MTLATGSIAHRAGRAVAALAFGLILVAGATAELFAHEWLAHRLRGPVHIVVDGAWVPIARGDTVHSGTIVRTGPSGTVEFRHGSNKVSLSPDTQVKFIDWSDRGQTWVQQWFGEVEVDVEARDVTHFAVQTPMMVAVVKGTRFRVSNSDNESAVSVIRGAVAVQDTVHGHHVDLGAGQSVSGGSHSVMAVSGMGTLPTVMNANGRPVVISGNGGAAMLANANAPGNSGNAPRHGGNAPGNSGNAPGHGGNAPGNSGSAPGNSGNAPGNSGNAPGNSGNMPGNRGGH
ncbi:FecR family protein [Pelagibacterium limicola]|uniref:FecR family protein n=1 Tax=Pelagibacterium limicola TaxID=2791022 RepID=UPI0018AF5F42|nr:FecR family protein [Pelagibacterium limicola]